MESRWHARAAADRGPAQTLRGRRQTDDSRLGLDELEVGAAEGDCRHRPQEGDYDKVKKELALYVTSKLLAWPRSNTWYDNECMYTFGCMHERWGSLRLMSQEGMEAFQKKLNEILRLGNGFANAGAIPLHVTQAGQAAIDAYMYKEKRKNDKPSSAQWLYDQALLQHHAHVADTLSTVDELRKKGAVCTWERSALLWLRYMTAARLRCRLRARVLLGTTGIAREQRAARAVKVAGKEPQRAPPGFYRALLDEHKAYYAPVDEFRFTCFA